MAAGYTATEAFRQTARYAERRMMLLVLAAPCCHPGVPCSRGWNSWCESFTVRRKAPA